MKRILRIGLAALAAVAALGLDCDPKQELFFQANEEVAPPSGDLDGRVTVDGAGRSGVIVALRQGATALGTRPTGTNGVYRFDDLAPGGYTVGIDPPAGTTCVPIESPATILSGQTTTVNFACTTNPTTGSIRGRVVVGGLPRQGAVVQIAGRPPVTTGTDGTFTISDVPPGTHVVTTTLADHACAVRTESVTVGQTSNVGDIVCTPQPGAVRGQVTVNGTGRGGVAVALRQGTATLATTSTDASGDYQFASVPPGGYTVAIAPPSDATCPAEQGATVQPNQTTIVNFACTFSVPSGAQIAGGYRLDGRFNENNCPAGLFPPAGAMFQNPGPIAVRAEANGQTFITIESDADVRGPLNTQTGEWTGMGDVPITGDFILRETARGRWQRDSGGTVILNTDASITFEIVDTQGTSTPSDDMLFCRAVAQPVTYRRLP